MENEISKILYFYHSTAGVFPHNSYSRGNRKIENTLQNYKIDLLISEILKTVFNNVIHDRYIS